MLPLELFKVSTFAVASLAGVIVNFAYYGLIFVFSLFFQVQQQLSPQLTGLAFLPMTIVLMAVNVLAGRLITRLGARVLMVLGLALAAVGYGLLMPVSVEGSYWLLVVPMLMAASGIALMVPTMTNATLSSVDASRAGIASGVLNSRGRSAACWAWRSLVICFGIPSRRPSCAACICRSASRWRCCWRPARCAGFGWERSGPWLDAPPPPPLLHRQALDRQGARGGVGDQAVRHSRDGASRAAGIHAGCLFQGQAPRPHRGNGHRGDPVPRLFHVGMGRLPAIRHGGVDPGCRHGLAPSAAEIQSAYARVLAGTRRAEGCTR